MDISIIIPILGQLNDTKAAMASVLKMAITNFELVIINNTTDKQEADRIKQWLEKFVTFVNPQRFKYFEQDNPGMVLTMQKGYELATCPIQAYLHNDVIIYEKGWDDRVIKEFENRPDLGLAGFFGHEGVTRDGGRLNCWSNMLEAEYHGNRTQDFRYIVTVDGFSIIARKEMLDKAGGFDVTNFKLHHHYDKNVGLDCLARGYHCGLIPVDCHHISGVTANRSDWQNQANNIMGTGSGDMDIFRANMNAFNNKWEHILPVIVDPNTGEPNTKVYIKK